MLYIKIYFVTTEKSSWNVSILILIKFLLKIISLICEVFVCTKMEIISQEEEHMGHDSPHLTSPPPKPCVSRNLWDSKRILLFGGGGNMRKIEKFFSLFLITAFVVFATFYIMDVMHNAATKSLLNGDLDFGQQVAGDGEVLSWYADPTKKEKLEKLKRDMDELDELNEYQEDLSEDITFLFAAINMNRKDHLGIQNYTFEKDYLEQIIGVLKRFRPEKIQIIIQKYTILSSSPFGNLQ